MRLPDSWLTDVLFHLIIICGVLFVTIIFKILSLLLDKPPWWKNIYIYMSIPIVPAICLVNDRLTKYLWNWTFFFFFWDAVFLFASLTNFGIWIQLRNLLSWLRIYSLLWISQNAVVYSVIPIWFLTFFLISIVIIENKFKTSAYLWPISLLIFISVFVFTSPFIGF